MIVDEKYMQRCLQLAKNGLGRTAPNPMVGAVLVYDDLIIGEGYHQEYGEAHAEPNAIYAVRDAALLEKSTLYVNLEPCSHTGKTPPCAALIIQKKIPRVVIGSIDPNPLVSGNGVRMMQEAGVEVITGVLDAENRELNKRFFTFQEQSRPYIFLKWAQSIDGFMDGDRKDSTTPPVLFSTQTTQIFNHKMRAEEAAILVGTNTVLMDNPKLTTRLWAGKNPLRVTIDRKGLLYDAMLASNTSFHILDQTTPSLIFTERAVVGTANIAFSQLNFSEKILPQLVKALHQRNINSLIVEGGSALLHSFIEDGLWDEARVEIAPIKLGAGVQAPLLAMRYFESECSYEGNKFVLYRN